MTFRFVLGLTLLVSAPALAQSAPGAVVDDVAAFDRDLDALFVRGGLTSEQAALRAPPVSPAVRRRIAEYDAAVALAFEAEILTVPTLRASATYERLSFIAPVVFPVGTMSFTIPFLQNSYDLQASAVVPLSDYIVRYPKLISAAHLGEDAARSNRRDAEVSSSQDARLAYYEWVRSQLQVIVAKRQLAQVKATLAQEKALLDVQRVSKADYLRIESQSADAERTLDQLRNLEELREEQLRIYIGVSHTEPLTVGEDIRQDVPPPVIAAFEENVRHATQRRFDFRALDLGISARVKQAQAEIALGFPRLSAFGTVEDARPNPRVFPQSDTFKFTWLAGVQLTWQLGDTLTAEAEHKRLIAEADELRADRENLYRGTRIEVLSAMEALQLAQLSLVTTQKGLAAAEESYRVRRELQAAQRATAVELVDAETDLTRARIAALNARVDLRVAITQLVHAIGNDTATAK
jgi:outer membrane protein TolC